MLGDQLAASALTAPLLVLQGDPGFPGYPGLLVSGQHSPTTSLSRECDVMRGRGQPPACPGGAPAVVEWEICLLHILDERARDSGTAVYPAAGGPSLTACLLLPSGRGRPAGAQRRPGTQGQPGPQGK